MNISWQPPLNERNVIDYHITLTSLYRNSQIPTQNVTVSTSIVMTMLDPGTFYLCTVAARTSAGLQQSLNILIKLPPDGMNMDWFCICYHYTLCPPMYSILSWYMYAPFILLFSFI